MIGAQHTGKNPTPKLACPLLISTASEAVGPDICLSGARNVSLLNSRRMPWRNRPVEFVCAVAVAASCARKVCEIAGTGFQAVVCLFVTDDFA